MSHATLHTVHTHINQCVVYLSHELHIWPPSRHKSKTSPKIASKNCLATGSTASAQSIAGWWMSSVSFPFSLTEQQLGFRMERVPFLPRWGVMWQQCCGRKGIGWDSWTILYYMWQLRDGNHSFHPVNKRSHIALGEKKQDAWVFLWDFFGFLDVGHSDWCVSSNLAIGYCSSSLLYFVIWDQYGVDLISITVSQAL